MVPPFTASFIMSALENIVFTGVRVHEANIYHSISCFYRFDLIQMSLKLGVLRPRPPGDKTRPNFQVQDWNTPPRAGDVNVTGTWTRFTSIPSTADGVCPSGLHVCPLKVFVSKYVSLSQPRNKGWMMKLRV
ncbi:hypothetical protein M378DRAFT_729666 [Amanita muscaria Koide BX008]|uniref:Uncharacterized protein n=1 Tax=Amanita muscaria (strain Koide BX008) TaxID=946122 RepID=A0A0C2SIY1_AMAMK|nr:hypothetical protein M378DRAFT_729666 [Amanita muscaria Koide BX008]